ncbi:MAG: type II secretion system F family protein [Candidatus Pacearchaeota archaeon]|nr:type II secretion system F family protein [Candidatus Pacearchaeota archaeon]
MKIKKAHWIGIAFSLIIFLGDFIFLRNDNIFFFLLGIGAVILVLPFVMTIMLESKEESIKSERFLEFARSLAENVKGGTPIGHSIMNMANKNFGSLTEHIQKLANQISIGIPISRAFETFAEDIGSASVRRAITLIKEAENSGGKIDDILDSVASSIYQTDKLKKERKAAISNLIVQGYVIFFIFIGIMLVMEFKILPLTTDVGSISSIGAQGVEGLGESSASVEELTRPFLYLLIIQGIFSGLAIGKLAEGSVKFGVKHSFILSVTAFLIATGARLFL